MGWWDLTSRLQATKSPRLLGLPACCQSGECVWEDFREGLTKECAEEDIDGEGIRSAIELTRESRQLLEFNSRKHQESSLGEISELIKVSRSAHHCRPQ
jgi:hypothetical protein